MVLGINAYKVRYKMLHLHSIFYTVHRLTFSCQTECVILEFIGLSLLAVMKRINIYMCVYIPQPFNLLSDQALHILKQLQKRCFNCMAFVRDIFSNKAYCIDKDTQASIKILSIYIKQQQGLKPSYYKRLQFRSKRYVTSHDSIILIYFKQT